MIDTEKYEGHAQGEWTIEMNDTYDECAINAQDYGTIAQVFYRDHDKLFMATSRLIADAPLILAEYKRLRGLLDKIDDVVYYKNEKEGQVLPVEKPNLELLRDIMMSYVDEAYQIRGDEGRWIE
tara:strand:+ start:195 stop:566 length:372 start_codon:yes stop_codon:yes gene_type:complete